MNRRWRRVFGPNTHYALVAKLPALELDLMEGGHMLLVTAPDRCVALVRRVAGKLTGVPASDIQAAFQAQKQF